MTIGRARDLLLGCALAAGLFGACSSGGAGTTGDAATTGDAGTTCGPGNCAAGTVCVRTQTVGGAQLCPQDGGTCPGGYEIKSSGCCEMIPSWRCAVPPAFCGDLLDCSCAQALCTSGQVCTMPRANEIDCTLLAP